MSVYQTAYAKRLNYCQKDDLNQGRKGGNIVLLKEMNMGLTEIVQEQLKALPEMQVKEVLDFIGYLKSRQEKVQWSDLMQAQEKSLANVWDNPDDEVWNHV